MYQYWQQDFGVALSDKLWHWPGVQSGIGLAFKICTIRTCFQGPSAIEHGCWRWLQQLRTQRDPWLQKGGCPQHCPHLQIIGLTLPDQDLPPKCIVVPATKLNKLTPYEISSKARQALFHFFCAHMHLCTHAFVHPCMARVSLDSWWAYLILRGLFQFRRWYKVTHEKWISTNSAWKKKCSDSNETGLSYTLLNT